MLVASEGLCVGCHASGRLRKVYIRYIPYESSPPPLPKTWLLISNRAQSITQSEDPDAIEMEPQTLLETARVSVPASGPEPGRISRVPRPANEPELSRIQIERAQFGLKLLYDGDDAQVE